MQLSHLVLVICDAYQSGAVGGGRGHTESSIRAVFVRPVCHDAELPELGLLLGDLAEGGLARCSADFVRCEGPGILLRRRVSGMGKGSMSIVDTLISCRALFSMGRPWQSHPGTYLGRVRWWGPLGEVIDVLNPTALRDVVATNDVLQDLVECMA